MTRILVDSSADFPQKELKEKNIALVPIHVTLGGQTYADGIDLESNDFYELLLGSDDFPTTSQPSPQDFLDIFKEAKEKGDELICILLSSELSGTYQSAVLAKSMADYDKIYLIDSLSATIPIKVMADYALSLLQKGLSTEETVLETERFKSRVKVAAALDTLEYLSRGGRISKAAAAIGEMASVKPIITLTQDGKIGILGKCLGRNKAICFLKKFLSEQRLDPDFPLYSVYTYGEENCSLFEEKMEVAGFSIQSRLQLGSTIGTHIGPDAFGIVYVTLPEEE